MPIGTSLRIGVFKLEDTGRQQTLVRDSQPKLAFYVRTVDPKPAKTMPVFNKSRIIRPIEFDLAGL